jgi:3-hydroxyisobutyrate dehydrogenase
MPVASPDNTRIGWVGTGIMGASMCSRLIDSGYEVTVFNRSKNKASSLIDKGAAWAESPAEVSASSDVTFAIVGMPDDVREVFLGPSGILAGAKAGSVAVDMTTSTPSLAVEIFEAAKEKQIDAIDAPVSGGDVGARDGALSIMVGGELESFERVSPIFQAMGKTIVRQGSAGSGQHTKMVNQILVAAGIVGVSESLKYAESAGLDPATVLQSVGSGAAGSWGLTNLGPRIIKGDFNPGFYVDHFVKDLGIALAECNRLNLKLPGLELADRLYRQLQKSGHGTLGIHALYLLASKA